MVEVMVLMPRPEEWPNMGWVLSGESTFDSVAPVSFLVVGVWEVVFWFCELGRNWDCPKMIGRVLGYPLCECECYYCCWEKGKRALPVIDRLVVCQILMVGRPRESIVCFFFCRSTSHCWTQMVELLKGIMRQRRSSLIRPRKLQELQENAVKISANVFFSQKK